jgi:hypothetical protein
MIGSSVLFVLAVVLLIFFIALQVNLVYAHYFGATKTVGQYQVVFSPYPSTPKAGDNSTKLNFSILDKNNNNIYNIYSALVISEKQSGNIINQIPYKLYEFSDISVPFTFPKPGDYIISLQTRITDDEKYNAEPMIANFDISAFDPHHIIPFDELVIYYMTPAAIIIAGLAVYLHSRNKL